jgi:3,4-dihydroxyphenylacetate 2,3-dioxygenase
LASDLVDRGKGAGLPCTLANDVHYPLDYGTVMPLVCYLDRAQRVPVVPVSVCLSANLDESFAWGRHIAQAAQSLGRRAAFVASGSVSHKLVRGPEKWPGAAEQQLDHRFARILMAGDYAGLWAWLPEYTAAAEPEMGGRHLAMMLGALIETGERFDAVVHAYGPSSGSGNYVISLASGTHA